MWVDVYLCRAVLQRQPVLKFGVWHRKASSYREVHYPDLWSETAFVFLAWGSFWRHVKKTKNRQEPKNQTGPVTLTRSCQTNKQTEKNKFPGCIRIRKHIILLAWRQTAWAAFIFQYHINNAWNNKHWAGATDKTLSPSYSEQIIFAWTRLRLVSPEWHNALIKRRWAATAAAMAAALSSNQPGHCLHIVPEGLLPLTEEYRITVAQGRPPPLPFPSICLSALYDLIIP